MALFDTTWYCNAGNQSTTGYYAVPQWTASTAYTPGQLMRQRLAPTVGSERCYVCIAAGTSIAGEPTWVTTRGSIQSEGTGLKWQECTGASAVNGDATNTPTWAAAKAINSAVTLGAIIKRANGASYWICSTAGSTGASEPAWPNNTAGTTQTDSTVTWTCLGVVGNFSGGGAPHARLANACTSTWFVAGNTVYVGDNHAESQATAITITPGLGATAVGRILCHNHSGNYPPATGDLTTGATVSTTANASLTFNPVNGNIYIYGMRFQAGVGASTANSFIIMSPTSAFYSFDNCVFQQANTNNAQVIQLNNSGTAGAMLWNNVQVSFGNVVQYIEVGTTSFTWQNTGQVLASGSSVPTTNGILAQATAGRSANVLLEALDLSQLTGALIGTTAVVQMGQWIVKDCKLNASATMPTPTGIGQTIQVVRSDSSGTAYKSARYTFDGTETTETSITRVGGAVDPTGQAQSRKIVTTANALWHRPFRAEPYAIWNPTTGANVTVTVYGTINAGALPNNDDIWLEVEYLGNASFPIGTIVSTTKASTLAANAAVASDSSIWNGLFTFFNPSDLSNVTLSNNNLTATGAGAGIGNVRGINGFGSGKYYWEYTITTVVSNSLAAGIATAALNLVTGGYNSAGAAGVSRLGSVVVNGTVQGSNLLGTRNNGDIIGIAIDLTAQLIWFRVAPSGNWNASGTANPATGAGGFSISGLSGAVYPLMSSGGTGDAITANFGGAAFSGAVPSGFTAGLAGSGMPFKLTTTLSSPQPGLPGIIEARVRVGKPSVTYYLDPLVALS